MIVKEWFIVGAGYQYQLILICLSIYFYFRTKGDGGREGGRKGERLTF